MVIIITRSDKGEDGKKARITLGCERSGTYRHASLLQIEDNTVNKKRRLTGTKKCGCPFLLRGIKLPIDDEWMLQVDCGVHNHPAADNLEGHSYAGRLSQEESLLLMDMSRSLVRPKEILHAIKQKNADNKTTMKTIYNVRQRSRVIEKAGRSQMQYLLGKLSEHHYIEWHRNCQTTDRVKDIFMAHPFSLEILRAFPKVLIMDCTYKTNRFRCPLLEIVGVTSTNLTFSVAFVYLEAEREDNYTWALSKLQSAMDDDYAPSVIVTDRELALMKAIDKIFPKSKHLLCIWHINKNILAKCKSLFESKDKWDQFMKSWEILVHSKDEVEYNHRLCCIETDFVNYKGVVEYVKITWLTPYKDRFVNAWTDYIMHYGNTTSNR